MGTFVTKSDLGIGTIVGSAVFNIFGVISVCGLFGGQKIPLDWYPITRDCLIYGIAVIILAFVLIDESVFWWEAMIMVISYGGYIILMAFNTKIEHKAQSMVKSIKKRVYPSNGANNEQSISSIGGGATNTTSIPMVPNESTPLHTASKSTQIGIEAPSR